MTLMCCLICCYRDRLNPVSDVYERTTGDKEQHEYEVIKDDQHHSSRHSGCHSYEIPAPAEAE